MKYRVSQEVMQEGDDMGATSGHEAGGGYSAAGGDVEDDQGHGSMDSFKARESRRLQQNREAAKRFRQKKKNLMNVSSSVCYVLCSAVHRTGQYEIPLKHMSIAPE
jgi:phage tail tape-measure protein